MNTKIRIVIITAVIVMAAVSFWFVKNRSEEPSEVKVEVGAIPEGPDANADKPEVIASVLAQHPASSRPSQITPAVLRRRKQLELRRNIPEVEIVRIQKQLNDIMKVNKVLKSLRATQMAEIRRIHDMARIHQRILSELAAPKNGPTLKKDSAEEILRQEKIRLIQKETAENQKRLEEIQRQDE